MKVAIFNDTRSDQNHLGCGLVMDQLESFFNKINANVVFRWPVGQDWRKIIHTLPLKGDIDLVVVNGEGTMHGGSANSRAFALAQVAEMARSRLSAPSTLINASLFDNDAQFFKELSKFSSVWVRDTASQKLAAEKGVHTFYCPDLTLSYDFPASFERIFAGVTDSVKHRCDFALRRFAAVNKIDYVSMVCPNIGFSNAVKICKFGAVKSAIRSWHREHKFGRLLHFNNIADFAIWVSTRKFVLTGRYHTVTICMATRTPFAYVESNTPKISALCEDAGIEIKNRKLSIFDIQRLTIDELKDRASFSVGDNIALEAFLCRNKGRFSEMFESLVYLVNNRTDY